MDSCPCPLLPRGVALIAATAFVGYHALVIESNLNLSIWWYLGTGAIGGALIAIGIALIQRGHQCSHEYIETPDFWWAVWEIAWLAISITALRYQWMFTGWGKLGYDLSLGVWLVLCARQIAVVWVLYGDIRNWLRYRWQRPARVEKFDPMVAALRTELAARQDEVKSLRASEAKLRVENQRFGTLLADKKMRQAVLGATHPDKAITADEKTFFAERFKVAQKIFEEIGIRK